VIDDFRVVLYRPYGNEKMASTTEVTPEVTMEVATEVEGEVL